MKEKIVHAKDVEKLEAKSGVRGACGETDNGTETSFRILAQGEKQENRNHKKGEGESSP
jgi:hypothetical protein